VRDSSREVRFYTLGYSVLQSLSLCSHVVKPAGYAVPGGGCGTGPVPFFPRGGMMRPGPHGMGCASAERREGEVRVPFINAESSKAAFSVIDSESAMYSIGCGVSAVQSYSANVLILQVQMC